MLQRYEPNLVTYNRLDYYLTAQGQRFPSVTTILNATARGKSQKLAAWRARIGEEEAIQIREEALERGGQLHERIANYLCGNPGEKWPEYLKPWGYSIKPMLMQIKPLVDVQLVEGAVFHPELCYGGKLDGIVQFNGKWCVVDWKTANTPQREDWIYRHKIQVAAYIAATNKTYGSNKAYRKLKLEHGLIVVALPYCEAQVFMMNWEQLENFFRQWLKRLRIFQAMKEF
jgi:hypothetical protein